jgi:hypothetical protein
MHHFGSLSMSDGTFVAEQVPLSLGERPLERPRAVLHMDCLASPP